MLADVSKMKIKFYNTASRKVEDFKTVDEGEVKMYSCGPTVYHTSHIGNLRTYVFVDVLKRALTGLGYNVRHVMNITDVGHLQSDSDSGDDKMSIAASREKKSPWDIARFYENAFFQDTKRLNIIRPTIVSRATEHIPEMINLVSTLVEKGFGYEKDGNVYFEVDKFPRYKDFARLAEEKETTNNRVDIDDKKKKQEDFVLWFSQSKYPNQIMKWDSPFGVGFPGWHIECSAMALKYLGERADIHSGGVDLIPVHHTNEIAQSECALGHKWINYWMHGGFLTVDNNKMSKSKGDFLSVDKLIADGFHPLAYRYLLLTANYRADLNFSYDVLTTAQNAYKGLYDKVQEWQKTIKEKTEDKDSNTLLAMKYSEQFWAALADDLKTSAAIALAWTVAKDEELSVQDKLNLFAEFDGVLGLKLLDAPEELSQEERELIDARSQARNNKQWAESDVLRDRLYNEYDIQIKDTADGMTWTRLLPKI